jgi:uncharacterized protein YbjT (DUF2867 family)
MKILVTGATGFVGRHVIRNLLEKQIEVRAIVRKGKESFFRRYNRIKSKNKRFCS